VIRGCGEALNPTAFRAFAESDRTPAARSSFRRVELLA
jgi:hypothetical protein